MSNNLTLNANIIHDHIKTKFYLTATTNYICVRLSLSIDAARAQITFQFQRERVRDFLPVAGARCGTGFSAVAAR